MGRRLVEEPFFMMIDGTVIDTNGLAFSLKRCSLSSRRNMVESSFVYVNRRYGDEMATVFVVVSMGLGSVKKPFFMPMSGN